MTVFSCRGRAFAQCPLIRAIMFWSEEYCSWFSVSDMLISISGNMRNIYFSFKNTMALRLKIVKYHNRKYCRVNGALYRMIRKRGRDWKFLKATVKYWASHLCVTTSLHHCTREHTDNFSLSPHSPACHFSDSLHPDMGVVNWRVTH